MKLLLSALALALLGWGPAAAQTNVLLAPGFEGLPPDALTDNGGVNQWGNYNDTAGNCVIQTSRVHGGVNALELGALAAGTQGYSIVYQNTGTSVASVPGVWYFRFWVLTTGASGSFNYGFFSSNAGNVDVHESGGGGTINASSLAPGSWTQISGSFTVTTATSDRLKATFDQLDGTGTFYIDDVVLTTNAPGGTGDSSGEAPAVSATGVTVAVDPPVALTNYTSMGEWGTPGNAEGWTTANVSGLTVAGGTLSGAADGSDPQVKLTGLGSGGPDLDLAFNDYMDVRLQVPSGFGGGVEVYFGATNDYYGTAGTTTGFDAASRLVTITNVATDGGFHVYRIFWGPHPYWRGNLSDVRVDPLGATAATGQAFALDYVRVGDLAGDIYAPVYNSQIPGPGTNNANGLPVQEMDSKHFRFCWDSSVASNAFWAADMPHKTLRNLEEVWKNQVWRMGFPEPSHPIGAKLPYAGQKHKVNFSTWYGGYWTGGDESGTVWMNITPDGLRTDPATWVPPHEFTHGCQESANASGAQTVDGQFWENNANYGREQWFYNFPWQTNQSGLDPYYADTSHFWLGHGRNYYLCWLFWLYLDENPDHLPGLGARYGNFFSVRLWREAAAGEYLWDTLARLAPATPVQDIMGYVARRNAVWDYSHRAALTAAAAGGDTELSRRWADAELQQRADDSSWWQTPIEFAPQQGGYKIVRLVPQGTGAGRVVRVNFHGLPDRSGRADWRASLVVEADDGTVRYSGLWNAGTNAVTLAANEHTVFLSVAGTPTNLLAESIDDSVQPYQSAPEKERFPWEVQISGAMPDESTNPSPAGLIQVANGGGWRAATATVAATAFVGLGARVLGTAKVLGNARIEDDAVVEGSATVMDYAVISGHALVRDHALVKDQARVRDYAMVIDNSVVAGDARVLQHGEITAGSVITNWATVKGSASTWHDSNVATGPQAWNDAVLDGDFSTAQSCSNGFQFGFEEYNPGPLAWINNRRAPRRLYAAYEFDSPQPSLAKDWLGVTDGYLQGQPEWFSFDGQRRGFVAFDGTDQFVILDRSVSDLREMSVAAWIKWSGGAGNQPAWYFGSGPTNCMYLTPDDGSASARFVITHDGLTQTLAWTNPLPVGEWAQVTVTLSNSLTGRLYVNGAMVAAGNITITPDQLNAPDVNTSPPQNYLARGAGDGLPFYRGALDDVRIYTGPLTDAEIAALQPPATWGGPGTLYVDLRATNAAMGSSLSGTWTNLGSGVGNFTRSGLGGYSTNVAGTGVPGVLFDGNTLHYASAGQSLADLTGNGARTIEVWAYNPSLQDEETTVALGDRNGTRRDCAFMYGSGATWGDGAMTHFADDMPWGAMGNPVPNGWHHLVYTYDGAVTAKVYADGQLWFTDTLGGPLVTPTARPIFIGCQNGAGQLFSGYINAVRIWGGEMSAEQVAANNLSGPWHVPAASQAVTFAAIPNVTLNAGVTLTVTNAATDPNQPPLPLAFSILSGPAGATINRTTGLFAWRPAVAQAGTTNRITLVVTNNASPGLSATQSFVAVVAPLHLPSLTSVTRSNGYFGFRVEGITGPDYTIQTSTNLGRPGWSTVFQSNSPAVPFDWRDAEEMTDPIRFYRVLIGP